MTQLPSYDWLNTFCVIWFLLCWVSYSQFAKAMAKKTHSLSSLLHFYRIDWMRRMLDRDQRVSDASLISNLERNVNFFASTTLLILAGIVTVLSSTDDAFTILERLPFAIGVSATALQLKLLLLTGVFVYAFFTFTWSMRQYNFCSSLLGAAPMPDDASVSDEERDRYALYSAKVIDQAAHAYNYGLRAYYFGMSILAWFINPWFFIAAVAFVVAVLYWREFHSKPLKSMLKIYNHQK
ncbi:DUF599 family protein [Pseudomaricurvus alkylphenolicus]|jgi:uncharacterized membrane protein|uniref:DUF599 domain-containing protein n=1 Tax=Pseudomaricurvus alkylphenolicus TaxID=1306991 RepID=UPI00142375FF|nr:DUF599 family protein [Pseudomaricurvus alkylphenolicus]NIB40723.1 DUF599 family protein [Pseudomaricurvus alkylphenolicus]